MTMNEILLGGGGVLLIVLTLIEIVPVKVNPWSAIGKLLSAGLRALGRSFNSEVLEEIKSLKEEQKKTKDALTRHIAVDDDRNADSHRQRILQFNNELVRGIYHSHEDFIEILAEIDFYERYCREHEDYKNSRAVHAISNIERVYDERLEKHDFRQE